MESHLIALDKCSGVCPSGIEESLQHIMDKTVMLLTGDNIQKVHVCGSNQPCASLEAGIEAAVHVVNGLFEEHRELVGVYY